MNLKTLVARLETLSGNLETAQTVRERVRIADRIYDALAEIEQRVEGFVVKEIGQAGNSAVEVLKSKAVKSAMSESPAENSSRFKNVTIAEGGRLLLKEHGVLHGKEIETHLKAGGYRTSSEKFQNTLVVAFRRDGKFENIGGNRWKLKESQIN